MERAPWEKVYCRSCRAEFQGDGDYCPECAEEVGGFASVITQPEASEAVCLNCGGPLPDDAGSLCEKCADTVDAIIEAGPEEGDRDPIPERVLSPGDSSGSTLRERILAVGIFLGVGDFIFFVAADLLEWIDGGWIIGIISGLAWIGLARLINFIIGPAGDQK